MTGWVRNEADGVVSVHAEGPAAAVAQFLEFLAAGPRGASVEHLEVRDVPVEGHEQFAVRGVNAGVLAVKRLAVQVEDHSLSHNDFEGSTDNGGVAIWDRGGYEQGGRVPWPEALDRGHAVFVLHGEKLHGGFALQRTREGPKPQWLLLKRRDEQARPGSDIVAERPASVASGRTLAEIATE